MKGPYERLKYDLRRVWECQQCLHHERSSGAVVTMYCRCQKDKDPRERTAMKLIEEGARRVVNPEDTPASSEPPATATEESNASDG